MLSATILDSGLSVNDWWQGLRMANAWTRVAVPNLLREGASSLYSHYTEHSPVTSIGWGSVHLLHSGEMNKSCRSKNSWRRDNATASVRLEARRLDRMSIPLASVLEGLMTSL